MTSSVAARIPRSGHMFQWGGFEVVNNKSNRSMKLITDVAFVRMRMTESYYCSNFLMNQAGRISGTIYIFKSAGFVR